MPISNSINQQEKIIYSVCTGVMAEKDFDSYISNIWSHDTYYGFNELFDTTEADWSKFNFSYLLNISKAASKLNTIDPDSKFAWVVLEGKQKELTDFYKAAKSLTNTRSRTLEAFYSKDEALRWLKTK